MMSCNISVA